MLAKSRECVSSMWTMVTETSARLSAIATKVDCPVQTRNAMVGRIPTTVNIKAAGRKCIRQKMLPITVIARKNAT